jgi:hypothetical protein
MISFDISISVTQVLISTKEATLKILAASFFADCGVMRPMFVSVIMQGFSYVGVWTKRFGD